MKLTEAQLKRIIAEEVQIAIDEGLLDFARGAAGAAGAVAGKLGSAVKGAAGKVGGAVKGTFGAIERGFDAATEKTQAALGDVTHAAGKAVYSGKVKDLEQSLPSIIDNINSGRSTAYGSNPGLEQEYTDLLEKLLGILKKGQSEIQEILMIRKRTMAPAASTSRRPPPPPPPRRPPPPPPPAAAPKRGFILPTSKE